MELRGYTPVLGRHGEAAMIAALAIMTFLGRTAAPETSGLLLGVLEQPQCNEDAGTAVRALFLKRGADWVALSSQDVSRTVSFAEVVWTIAFDGRSLGSLT